MKKSRSYAAVVALLVLALSLFSSPVMPAEHPWDSDGGNGTGGTGGTGTAPTDSTKVLSATFTKQPTVTGSSEWLTDLALTISTQLKASFNSILMSFTKSGKSTGNVRNRSYRSSGRTANPSE